MFESQQQINSEHVEQPTYSEELALKNLSDQSDLSDQYYAAWWLGRMRSRHPQTIPHLLDKLTILNQEKISIEERGVALNAIRALSKLDATNAIEPLIKLLHISDTQIQTEAARSLGTLKASKAIPSLTSILQSIQANNNVNDLSNDFQITVIKAIGSIGTNEPSVIEAIQDRAGLASPLLRSASCSALARLTDDPIWIKPIIALLNHREPLIRRGALLDLGASGHPDALEPIQTAGVESSLKLIALKVLAEQTMNETILAAMDGLL